MQNIKMNKLFALSVILLFSCSQKKEEMYTPSCLSDSLENRISINELDSLIDNSPYWKLTNFKTTNRKEQYALSILKEKLLLQKVDIGKLIIYDIIDRNDSTIAFSLDHIDGLIYSHNLDKKNKELAKHTDENGDYEIIPSATGNVTGVEGTYIVNLVSQTLEINYAQ